MTVSPGQRSPLDTREIVCFEVSKRSASAAALGRRSRFQSHNSRWICCAIRIDTLSPPSGLWNRAPGSTPNRSGSLT